MMLSGFPCIPALMCQRPENRIEDLVQVLAEILGQKSHTK